MNTNLHMRHGSQKSCRVKTAASTARRRVTEYNVLPSNKWGVT